MTEQTAGTEIAITRKDEKEELQQQTQAILGKVVDCRVGSKGRHHARGRPCLKQDPVKRPLRSGLEHAS